jgi:hypothetical protein
VARERTIEEVAESLDKLDLKVQRLAERFDNPPFVRTDLHNEQIRSLTSSLESVARLQMAILAVLGSILIAAVVAVITAVARGGIG